MVLDCHLVEHEHPHVVLKVVKRLPGQKGFAVLPRPWVVERMFALLTPCRRLQCDYEVLMSTLKP